MYRFKVIWRWKYIELDFVFANCVTALKMGRVPVSMLKWGHTEAKWPHFSIENGTRPSFKAVTQLAKRYYIFKKKFKLYSAKIACQIIWKRKKSRICITFRHYHSGKFRSCKLPFFSPIACIISMRWWHAVLSLYLTVRSFARWLLSYIFNTVIILLAIKITL